MAILTELQFKIKYDLYSQELMNIAYGYLKNKDDSLDIIQNVFIKFINHYKKFNDLNHEKYWLIRVTINECRDFLRKKAKQAIVNSDLVNSFLQIDDHDSKLHYVTILVRRLPEKYRVVVILFYWNSLSIKDIANIIKVKENTVKKRLERARKLIKEEMEG